MKKLSVLAILVLCVCMLFSCGGAGTSTQGSGETTPSVGSDPRGEKLAASEYTVCISSDAGEKTRAAVSELTARLSDVYGTRLQIREDLVSPGESIPTGTKEILIGSTNRAESQALIEGLRQMDYRVRFDGTRLAIGGPSDEATAAAIRYFLPLVEDDGLFIAKDFEHTFRAEYAADPRVNGKSLGTYTIVYKDSKISKESAQQLAEILARDCGYALPVVSEADAPASECILVGSEAELALDLIPEEYGYGIKVGASDVYLAYTTPKMAARLSAAAPKLFSAEALNDGYEAYSVVDPYRIVLLGDSNTANARVQLWLETFLATRYPRMTFEVINAGIAGDTPVSAAKRLSWDVIAHDPDMVIINFGCNGVLEKIGSIDGVVNEDVRAERVRWFLDSTEDLINAFDPAETAVILATPVAYDEWMESTKENYKNAYIGFEMMRDGIIALAETYSLGYVDYYSNLSVIIKDYREEGGSSDPTIFSDRVHMDYAGALAAALSYLEDDWGYANDLVSSVSVSVSTNTAMSTKADVRELCTEDDYVSYLYTPQALPLPANKYYEYIKAFGKLPLTDHNRELLTVTGLNAGTYEIRYDGKCVKTVTADELAAGVNLSEEAANPTQAVAKKIFDSLKVKTDYSSTLRAHVYIEFKYMIPKGLEAHTAEERIALYTEAIEKELVSGYLKSCMENYLKTASQYDTIYANSDYSDYKSVALANALTYTVEIVKVDR